LLGGVQLVELGLAEVVVVPLKVEAGTDDGAHARLVASDAGVDVGVAVTAPIGLHATRSAGGTRCSAVHREGDATQLFLQFRNVGGNRCANVELDIGHLRLHVRRERLDEIGQMLAHVLHHGAVCRRGWELLEYLWKMLGNMTDGACQIRIVRAPRRTRRFLRGCSVLDGRGVTELDVQAEDNRVEQLHQLDRVFHLGFSGHRDGVPLIVSILKLKGLWGEPEEIVHTVAHSFVSHFAGLIESDAANLVAVAELAGDGRHCSRREMWMERSFKAPPAG